MRQDLRPKPTKSAKTAFCCCWVLEGHCTDSPVQNKRLQPGSSTPTNNIDANRDPKTSITTAGHPKFKSIVSIDSSLDFCYCWTPAPIPSAQATSLSSASFSRSSPPSPFHTTLYRLPEEETSISLNMNEFSPSTAGERSTHNHGNLSESSTHTEVNDRSFRVAGTYTTISTSTVYHEGEIEEFDLEQLDLEDDQDLEDLDSEDDCKFYLDLELFHLNELNLDDIDLDGLDEDDRHTLTQ
ncbi:hypothetical protein IWZ00DRAFT_490002 [Phyllosticta capitalensis]